MAADDAFGSHADDARRRLEAIRAALVAEMEQRLRTLDQAGGALTSTADALDNARKIRTQVLGIMRDDGLPVVIGTVEAKIADAVDSALRSHVPVTATDPVNAPLPGSAHTSFDAEARASIERTTSGLLDDVAAVFGDGAQAIRRAIDVGVNTGAPLERVVEDVRQAIDTTFVKASAAVDTAIMGAGRRALIIQAERGAAAVGEEVGYAYLGPDDARTRPFCAKCVGRVFTLAALKRMDNGSGLPVDVSCGGFSCRHLLSPISLEDARAQGYEVTT